LRNLPLPLRHFLSGCSSDVLFNVFTCVCATKQISVAVTEKKMSVQEELRWDLKGIPFILHNNFFIQIFSYLCTHIWIFARSHSIEERMASERVHMMFFLIIKNKYTQTLDKCAHMQCKLWIHQQTTTIFFYNFILSLQFTNDFYCNGYVHGEIWINFYQTKFVFTPFHLFLYVLFSINKKCTIDKFFTRDCYVSLCF
jgi:hypothetical protein